MIFRVIVFKNNNFLDRSSKYQNNLLIRSKKNIFFVHGLGHFAVVGKGKVEEKHAATSVIRADRLEIFVGGTKQRI